MRSDLHEYQFFKNHLFGVSTLKSKVLNPLLVKVSSELNFMKLLNVSNLYGNGA